MKEVLAKGIMELMREYLNDDPDAGYDGEFIGIVENNNDPEKMGRCQIRIHGIHDDIPTSNLQWMHPDFPLSIGYSGSFIVPEKGTSVLVKFVDGDIYQARYYGKAMDNHSGTFKRSNKDDSYPDTCILYETKNGDYLKINRSKGEFYLRTGSGSSISIDTNGNIEITNEGTNKGDMNLTLRGNFKLDNRAGNTTLITNDCSVSAFGSVNVVSNGSLTVDTLDDQIFRTNTNFDIVTGNNVTMKSKSGIRTETDKHAIRGNDISLAPESISNFTLSVAQNVIQTPLLTVTPSMQGGPFNCIPFDPLTGQPHQGRVVMGMSNMPNTLEIADEVSKKTEQIIAKYALISKRATLDIAKKYASIGMAANMTVATITSTAITDTKDSELASVLASIEAEKLKEIEQLTDDYFTFLETPIFNDEKTKNKTYNVSLESAETAASVLLDRSGNKIPQDVVGCGDGLVVDETFEDGVI